MSSLRRSTLRRRKHTPDLPVNEERCGRFEEAALPHLDALYGFALLLTVRRDEAEDLVQETFLRAFRFFHQYEHGTNCKAWLFTIMKHIYLNQAPQRARTVLCPDPADDEEGDYATLWQDFVSQKSASLENEIFTKDIETALGLLPEAFRLVVVLKDVQGFSYAEIARLLDCPMGTVMSRLSRARDLLRQFLRDYAVPEPKERTAKEETHLGKPLL
jgi:RNA polymerase sigma-70 factor (ECF subfamily)